MDLLKQIQFLKDIISRLANVKYMQIKEISEVETELKKIIRHLGSEQSRVYFTEKIENSKFVINPFGSRDSNEIIWNWMINDFRNLAKELIIEIEHWEPQKEPENENQTKGNINIQNFQGIFGDVTDSTINQNLNIPVIKGNFDSLSKFLNSHKVEKSDINELEKALNSDPMPEPKGDFGPNVSIWIVSMLRKVSDGSWKIGIGAAGTILATAIIKYYGIM